MSDINNLFENNSKWAKQVSLQNSNFFADLEKIQQPKYLWIGCSDSRVSANEIIGLKPGEVFVHRNIGNVVVYSDLNCLSVIQFAVDVLKVSDILVVGHYNCAAVNAAERKSRLGLVDNWIHHIQDIRNRQREFFNKITDEHERINALCELNVIEQVNNIALSSVLNDAWSIGSDINIHGLIYKLSDGLLHDLHVTLTNAYMVEVTVNKAVEEIKQRYNNQK